MVSRSRPHLPALIPGLVIVALALVWAIQDGGYDTETWYWGALVMLAVFAGVLWFRHSTFSPSRPVALALAGFAGYVAWSYLSIAWAGSKGDALDGSNRALLYLLMFTVAVMLPWTTEAALVTLVAFALGIGGCGIVLLARLSSGHHLGALVVGGRLAAPTGYFNSTAALFTIAALISIALAARRELPAELRGALSACACADLQLAVIVQSRGWLFTLPLVAIIAIALVPDRLRVTAATILPLAGALVLLGRLLAVFKGAESNNLAHAAGRAGTAALITCGAVLVAATALAWGERLLPSPRVTDTARRRAGALVAALAIAAFAAAGVAATHGHPFAFIRRQWNGFSHPQQHFSTQSHFGDVGSGRYDFWRVSLDVFTAHPIGGLGQDNFDDYYVLHRRTDEEPAWTHSLELRLLAHTGLVGFGLFGVFLLFSVSAALRSVRRSDGLAAAVAGGCLLALVDWLVHGSVDWFWEIPALSGPALGFLGIAVALGERRRVVLWRRVSEDRGIFGGVRRRLALRAGTAVLFAVAVVVLGLPYLSAREVAQANSIASADPTAALSDLGNAAELDPLSAYPGRAAGTIALQSGYFAIAKSRFAQVVAREPGGWYGWFGEGLAASALGQRSQARRLLMTAERINSRQPIIGSALARLDSANPVTPREGLAGIQNAQ
jgi:hypothetical protein